MRRLVVAIILLLGIFVSRQSNAADADCAYRYWYDDQRSYCLSCSQGTPPWGSGSFYAHRLRWYVLCQSCNVPCQTQTYAQGPQPNTLGPPQAAICPAVSRAGDHLKDALVYALRSPETASGYSELERAAPELALTLLSLEITNEKAPQLDLRHHTSFIAGFPTPGFLKLIRDGADLSAEDVQVHTRPLPDRQGLMVEAKTELRTRGAAVLILSSSMIDVSTKEVIRPLNEYVVYLQDSGKRVKVLQYPGLSDARVFRVTAIKSVDGSNTGL